MIQHAFTSAYTNQVSQRNQLVGTGIGAAKDAATLIGGVSGFGGESVAAKGASHALAGRIGGVGGNIMLATLQEKTTTMKANQEKTEFIKSLSNELATNPINNAAIEQLRTVAEYLRNPERKKEKKEGEDKK